MADYGRFSERRNALITACNTNPLTPDKINTPPARPVMADQRNPPRGNAPTTVAPIDRIPMQISNTPTAQQAIGIRHRQSVSFIVMGNDCTSAIGH